MTYKNVYDLFLRLRKEDIKVDPNVLREVIKLPIAKDHINQLIEILSSCSLERIKLFAKHSSAYPYSIKICLIKDIPDNELEKYLEILENEENLDTKHLISCACQNKKIREDEKAFNIILKQKDPVKTCVMLRACCEDAIRMDKKALHIIASQKTNYEMSILLEACEDEAIRKDKSMLKLIEKQDTEEKKVMILRACQDELIRNDREVLNEIASAETADTQELLLEKYHKKLLLQSLQEKLSASLETNDMISQFIRMYEQLHGDVDCFNEIQNKEIGMSK